MKKEDVPRELDPYLDEIISEKLARYTCQLFEKSEKGLKPYGSGVLVVIYNIHFILTASHVVEIFSDPNKDLYIRIGHTKYINIIGQIKATRIERSQGVDLAYIKLDPKMVKPLSKPYYFLTIDRIRKHIKVIDAMHYCVLGFPEKNINKEVTFMDTGASAYFLNPSHERVYDFYGYNNRDWIILEMKGKGSNIRSGEKKKIDTHFYGLSGCGLWYLDYYFDKDTGKYDIDYRLIGIMTEFKKSKYFCLVGCKIHLIIEALEVIEKMVFKRKSEGVN